MLCWGFGDFMMQKSTRKLGDWETIFFVTLFGVVLLAPFVWKNIPRLAAADIALSASAALVLLVAAVLQLEGFKRGKLSVLEPLMSFEIFAASALSFLFLRDHISPLQIGLIAIVIVGLFMVSFRGKLMARSFFVEKGVYIFVVGSLLMGAADFLLGWGARETDPLMANFIMNVVMLLASGLFIAINPASRASVRALKANRGLLLALSLADNVAWIAYAVAMTIVPIAVATGLSESSIIIAVLLGLFINKERLQRHQKIGLAIAVASVISLAAATAG